VGTTRGKDVQFKCWNMCLPEGCDGHALRMDFQRTSDVMIFYLDDEIHFSCCPATWKAMVEAEKNCG
jgi:hypothetical protein